MGARLYARIKAISKMVAGKHDGRVSFEEVRRLLDYDQHTGILRWRIAGHGHTFKGYKRGYVFAKGAGPVAGLTKKRGHVEVKIRGTRYMAHRLIWLWMTGLWPKYEIDHKDVNPGNNSWANLREATGSQNVHNRRALCTSELGLKGVSPQFAGKKRADGTYRRTGRWKAQIRVNGRVYHLGYFKTPEEAHEAYKRAADKFYGVFARA